MQLLLHRFLPEICCCWSWKYHLLHKEFCLASCWYRGFYLVRLQVQILHERLKRATFNDLWSPSCSQFLSWHHDRIYGQKWWHLKSIAHLPQATAPSVVFPPRHVILVSVFQQSWAFKATEPTVDSYLEAEVMTRQPYHFTKQIPPVQASWNISFLVMIHCVDLFIYFFPNYKSNI